MTIPLFEPITLRGVTAKNRIALSPMHQYSAVHGHATDWHFANLSRFAIGGFGTICVEATSVSEAGRVTHGDLGIWSDDHMPGLRRLADFVRSHGSLPAIQIGHAGRKGATQRPWEGHGPLNGDGNEKPWKVYGPSAIPVADNWQTPDPLGHADLERIKSDWIAATRRADAVGFDLLEIHAAHGYLLHSFLSPLSNTRDDQFGGNREGRMRFPLEIAAAVRDAWPEEKPLSVRISAVDGFEGGWTIEDSVVFAKELKKLGVDLVDCSSGGLGGGGATAVRIPRSPGFQVPFASQVRREADIRTIAVGLIRTAELANEVIAEHHADIVAIGREALVHPNWPHLAAQELTGSPRFEDWPAQSGWWLERREASLRNQ